jgi:branched-chain amino acid transport system permease protein
MQILVNILVLTSIYALISCGYVLIYRVSRVLNLAHGEFMMLGAYGLLATGTSFGAHPWVAVGVSAVMALMVGVTIYFVLMRYMTGESVLAAVLCTIAVGILLRGLITLTWGAQQHYPLQHLGWTNTSIAVGGDAKISAASLALIIATIACYSGLFLFLRYTRWGIRMRAAGQNPLLAAQRGIRLNGIYALAWGLATFTGGIAGMLIACDSGLQTTMVTIGLKAFPATLVGGLDSLLGALVGSLVISAAEVLLIQHVDPLLSDVAPFFILLAMLIFRPWGLFGTREEIDRV